MMSIFSDFREKICEIFMDDFSIYGSSFDDCLSNLDRVLQRCEETNLFLNWEKCHFMVNEGIVFDEDMTTLDTTKNIAYMHICQVISSANYSIIYLCYPEQKYFTHFCVLSNCRCMGYLYNSHMKIRVSWF